MENELFSKGFPTNRIPITIPSSGQKIVIRETTVVELKSMCKTIIDNIDRRQMNVIYDALTEYLQAMVLTSGVDVKKFTEMDRLYCLMVFFQMSFYKEPMNLKCQYCGVDIVYRYDMSKYLQKLENAYVDDQVVEVDVKTKRYQVTIGWPSVETMSLLMNYFYDGNRVITDNVEQTQFGINFIMAFIKHITVVDILHEPNTVIAELDLNQIDDFSQRIECINELPSIVVFDEQDGLFAKTTGYFINRMENCFSAELCPQCHKQTDYGIPHSSLFYSLFYGSLKSLYGFILNVECLLLFRYDCLIFDKEKYMTYNDFSSLIHQLGVTVEKDNEDRKRAGNDGLYKGLWYIREVLNTLIFPEDKKK